MGWEDLTPELPPLPCGGRRGVGQLEGLSQADNMGRDTSVGKKVRASLGEEVGELSRLHVGWGVRGGTLGGDVVIAFLRGGAGKRVLEGDP